MAVELTTGAVRRIFNGETDDVEPVVQVLSVKQVNPNQGSAAERYRLIISDGEFFMQAMLATQLNHLVHSKELDRLCVISLSNYTCQTLGARKLAVVLTLDLVSGPTAKIGDAKSIDTPAGGGAAAGSAAQAAPAAPNAASNYRQGAAQVKKGPAKGPAGGAPIYPIEGLSPYQNKWTIKARVTSKTEIKHWSNQRGDGKLFSANLLDETGEIRATGFNDAVDKLYHVLEEGKVFFISQARVNIAKKQFSNLNNEYELTFDGKTIVEPCHDADDVPQVKFSFVQLGDLESLEKDATCDVIGIVKDVGELGNITSKATQRSIPKRDVTLVDSSSFAVRLTVWGRTAETFEAPGEPVIAFKGVKVGDFGGRSLSMISSSTMVLNPDIGEAHSLRGWYDSEGNSASLQQYSNTGAGASTRKDERRLIAEVRDNAELGQGEKPDYFAVRATVMLIRDKTVSYPACPTDKCNKKLVMEGEEWRCEKCDRSYEAPEYRYMLSLSVGDHTGQIWLSSFNDVGQLLIGISAGQLEDIKNDDETAFAAQLQNATLKMYDFSCRAKAETYQEVSRVKYSIMRASPVDFAKAGHELVEEIRSYGLGN